MGSLERQLQTPEPDKPSQGSLTTNTDGAVDERSSPSLANESNINTDIEKTTTSPASEEVDVEKRQLTGVKWFLFIISTLTSIFLYSLDNTIVADIVPAIVNSLGGEENLPWLSVGFMIGGLALILPLGQIYATYDVKWVYIISTVVFLAASALCGAAPNMNAEIIGRVFAGAGGNGMYFGMLALMSINTTTKERPFYLSLTGLVWGMGTVLGPVVGGGFVIVNWRWGFYINLLFGAVLLPIYIFVVPSSHPAAVDTGATRARTFDHVGTILSVGAFVTIIMGINFGGTLYAWNSAQVIALFVVSAVLWIAFAVQQTFNILTSFEKRLFPVHLLKNREIILLFIACAAAGAEAYITVYYIPIYFQFTQGDSAIMAAVRLLPFIFLLITAIPASGALMSMWGYYKPFYLGGAVLALIGGVLMSRVKVNTPVAAIYGYEVLIGLGTGVYTQASFAVAQAVVSPADAPSSLTLMLVAQLAGMSFGLAIGGAVFVNTSQAGLFALLRDIPHEDITKLISGTSGALFASLTPELQDAAREVIVGAWQNIFIGVYVAAAASIIVAVLMKNGKINVVATAAGP